MTEITDFLSTPRKPVYSCKIAAWISTLDDDDAKAVSLAFSNPDWSTNGLFEGLSKFGLDAGRSSLDKHRKGLCSCGS